MKRTNVLSIAFLMALVSFPLISVGMVRGSTLLWGLGLLLLLLGLLISPVMRFVRSSQDPRDTPDVREEP